MPHTKWWKRKHHWWSDLHCTLDLWRTYTYQRSGGNKNSGGLQPLFLIMGRYWNNSIWGNCFSCKLVGYQIPLAFILFQILGLVFFFLNNLFTQNKKIRENIEQCPTRYTLDLNRRNATVKIKMKEKTLKTKPSAKMLQTNCSSNLYESLMNLIVDINIFRFFASSNLSSPCRSKLIRLLSLTILGKWENFRASIRVAQFELQKWQRKK